MSPELKRFMFEEAKKCKLIDDSDYEELIKLSANVQFCVLRMSIEQKSIGNHVPVKYIMSQVDNNFTKHANYMAKLISDFEELYVNKKRAVA